MPVPLLEFFGTSLLAFIEVLRFTTSAFTGHASETAVAQANPANAGRETIKCIAFSSLTRPSPLLRSGSKKLSWKGSYSGLTGPATAAHFHSGEPGKNGGVVVPISPNASPFEGSATLTDAQAAELLAGKWYVNVHTDANKGGEIRGQVTK
jgi:hypothetical protein